MPERTARQGRPEKDRPCRRGIDGFRTSSGMGQGFGGVFASQGRAPPGRFALQAGQGPTAALRLG
jgi:hypothetical protein